MKIYPTLKIAALLVLTSAFYSASAQSKNDGTKMNAFVNNLMSKMTLDEKVGQLTSPMKYEVS